jgi:hypothetical protein
MTLRTTLAALVIGLALATAPVLAHEPSKGPNGGLQVDAGTWHAELVADGTTTVTIFLADAEGKTIPAAGFKANAIFVVDGKPQRFTLEAADGSRLVGTAPVGLPAGAKGAVQLTAPDGQTGQAKF